MKKAFFTFSLFLTIAIFGCSQGEISKPFLTVLPGKSLLHYSQFELIDDFNSGVSKNRRQGNWVTFSSSGSKISLEAEKKDSVNRFGGSLSVHYEIPANGSVKVSSALHGLDMSQAKLLIGRVEAKTWRQFRGRASIGLQDADGKSARVKLGLPYVREGRDEQSEWFDIEIPTKLFRELDLNRLENFELILESSGKPVKDNLLFDEFAFFGPADLYFESARDNLKSFPSGQANPERGRLIQENDPERFLYQIAKDTWRYFEGAVDSRTNLVLDHIRLGKTKGVGDYTSPTNLAFYWLAQVSAVDLGFIPEKKAIRNIKSSLETLGKLERWKNSFYYNYYQTGTLQVTRRYVSVVDNGWLAAALVVVRQTFPGEFDRQIEEILRKLNFSEFYDPSNGQLKLGYDQEKGIFSPYHYGLLVSEARLASYLAIGKGDLPKSHWARIYRTLPKEWEWQAQVPNGTNRTLFETSVFEGYYLYEGKKVVPSWGGSLFEFLSPTLLLNEQALGQNGFRKNNVAATEAHIDFALNKKGYPVWGIAPAAVQNGKQWAYREFGVKGVAAKGYPDEGVITPYASILAIEIEPEKVIRNLRKMLELYPDFYGSYGFYDSIDLVHARVNEQYLALDQGMTLVALTNYLKKGAIRDRFHRDPIGKNGEPLLTEEYFF